MGEMASSPLLTRFSVWGTLALMVVGLGSLLKKVPVHGVLCLALLSASAVGAAAFKWHLKVEWIFWYFFPLVLPAAWMLAAGIRAAPALFPGKRSLWSLLTLVPVLTLGTQLVGPWNALNAIQPYESQREAWQLTRGHHEPRTAQFTVPTGASKVYTVYLWRHIKLYDPRADLEASNLASMVKKLQTVDEVKGELYVVMGMIGYVEHTQPDLVRLLRDERYFKKVDKLWAQERGHTLEVYHYQSGAARLLGLPTW